MIVIPWILAAMLIIFSGICVMLLLRAKEDVRAAEEELERFEGIVNLETYQTNLENRLAKAKTILPQFERLAQLEEHKLKLQESIQQHKSTEQEWIHHIAGHELRFNTLMQQFSQIEGNIEMQSFGFYQPKYGFEDAERYKLEIKRIRDHQKEIVKSGRATQCAQDWVVEGSAQKGAKMIKEHSKLMLRAFNGECDAAIAKVRYNNVDNLEKRLNRSFEMINKLGASKALYLTIEYQHVKLQELYLVHEHRDQLNKEKEEQRRIREQMREEEKAIREIEKARKKAEEEERAKTNALERAREELANSDNATANMHLLELIRELELELKDALDRKERAIARASLTRSGHVYVISNVGVFGEGVYKIGMTRRLEPLDRVKELGDASVPFPFDIHAMIYSDDAPGLEHALHKHFASRRLNLVNLRREFFRVSLADVQRAVGQYAANVTFTSFPEAEEFRRSNSMRDATSEGPPV